MIKTLFTTLVIMTLVMGQNGYADIVVYELSGEPGNQVSTAGTPAANATAADLTRGAGLTGNAGLNSLNSVGWNTLDATDFVSFGFTVDAGYFANLGDITFTGRSSNTGPGTLAIRSSLDGFASNLFTFTQTGTTDTQVNYDASGLGPVTGALEFRIFSLNNTSANGGTVGTAGTWRVGSANVGSTTQLTIGGNIVAIPEPTSAGLIGLVFVAGALTRRRQR
ncbi:MAG TPA: PEP-CTERM sorting domain-containing protein [Pirellulaceae bacterium]|nr:PEP-CTERM sorting domain-containing protein [Pirellulaceae bacterium]HMO94239.1 PEP-CTERM sorting domain-containing protein [Pirellulaceae bacterium]HMP70806.1 PEP-CTERM sorting domain-containing protein [Pirellulaceae bacterium]